MALLAASLIIYLGLVSCQQTSLEASHLNDTQPKQDTLPLQHAGRIFLDHNAAQVRQVFNWPGSGYNSASETVTPSCLEHLRLSSGVGQKKIDLSFKLAESREELWQHLGLEGHVGFNWGILSGSGGLSYVDEDGASSYNLYLVLKATLTTEALSVTKANLRPDAQTLLEGKGYDALVEKCGDSFVSSLTLGGSYHAVFRIVASSYDQKEEFKGYIKIRILFATITVHFHETMADIHRRAKEMTFHVLQSPNLLPNLRSGDFAQVKDATSFITEAEAYLERLEAYCRLTPTASDYDYPTECVRIVTLQDYLTLTPYLPSAQVRAERRRLLEVKESLAQLVSRSGGLEKDLLHITAQPYMFEQGIDPTWRSSMRDRYERVKTLTATFYADLDYCMDKTERALETRCTQYLPEGAQSRFADLSGELYAWQADLPVKTSSHLPQTCQEVASFGALNPYQTVDLYYQGSDRVSFGVMCIPSPDDPERFEEYVNLPLEDDYLYRVTGAADERLKLPNVSRLNHRGNPVRTSWQRYRLEPKTLTVDTRHAVFSETVGRPDTALEFGRDSKEPLKVGDLYGCSNAAIASPMTVFSFISLKDSDFYIDPLSVEAGAWQVDFLDKSGTLHPTAREDVFDAQIDITGQRLIVVAELEGGECLNALLERFALIPRAAVVAYDM